MTPKGHPFHNGFLKDMQRPLYMQPLDAIEYGVIDRIIKSEKEDDIKLIDDVKSPEQWDREVTSAFSPLSLTLSSGRHPNRTPMIAPLTHRRPYVIPDACL